MFRRQHPPPDEHHQDNFSQEPQAAQHHPQRPPPNDNHQEHTPQEPPTTTNKHQPTTPPSPSLQSRHPRSPTSQTLHTAAATWLADPARSAATCPVPAVTALIRASTSTGRTLLSIFAPAKLTAAHSDMRARDRLLMVGDLRAEVLRREERATALVGVGEMAEAQGEGWEGLRSACEGAVELVGELRGVLGWCEREFEGRGEDGGEFVPRRVGEREGAERARREEEGGGGESDEEGMFGGS